MRLLWFYGVAFVSGYLVMGIEFLGLRLLAPDFGYSLYVFGSLIGLVLFALSGGYLLGGWLGDKGVAPGKFSSFLFGASLYFLAMRASYPSILTYLAEWGNITGALAATAALFLIPIVFLGAVSPYLVKRMHAALGAPVGISSGSIYAVGTVGSLAGTFLTAFYMLPEWGSGATFSVLAATMLVCSLVPLIAAKRRRYVLGLGGLLMLLVSPAADERVIYAADTPYVRIEVVDYGSFLGLRTDRRTNAIHSYRPKSGGPHEGSLLYALFGVGPAFHPVRRALLLGAAGGVIPAVHEAFGQQFHTDAVELDPGMIEVGRRFFYLNELKDVSLYIKDARAFLAQSRDTYDLIEIDLFGGSAEIPFHLATQEFFELTRAHLAPRGTLLMNVYDPSYGVVRDPILNTIASVYPYVFTVDVGTGSHFALATQDENIARSIIARESLPASGHLQKTMEFFLSRAEKAVFDPSRLTLTDDRAPLERLSYRALYGKEK